MKIYKQRIETMVLIALFSLFAAFAFAQYCSDGAVMYVGPYSGIDAPGECVSLSGVVVSVEFGVCYKSSLRCNMPCDTSCCTSDFESCMECTGCDQFYDSSFKIENGFTYSYFDGNDTECATVAAIGDELACIYDAVHICQGNNQVDFTEADYISRTCTNETESTSSSTSGSEGSSTSTSGGGSNLSGARSREDTSGATKEGWVL